MKNKSRSKEELARVATTLTLIIILIVLSIISIRTFGKQAIKSELPSVSFDNEIDYSENSHNTNVLIKAMSGVIFKSDVVEQTVDIPNDASNEYLLTVSIYLGDGTLLYDSDFIAPGDSVTSISLITPLKSGLYKNCVMAYKCYSIDESHSPINQCEFPIEIECI